MRSLVKFVTALAIGGCLFAQSPLTTTGAPTLYLTGTGPVTFLWDIEVTEPQGIVLHQIDLQCNTAYGTNGQLGVYLTNAGDTAATNYLNAAAWNHVSDAAQVHAGGFVSWTLNPPVFVAPGTYGIALHCVEIAPVYHSGTVSAALPATYSSNEMIINAGGARIRGSSLTDPFSGTGGGNTPRQPYTSFHYVVGDRYVNFIATPTGGVSPLDVQFTALATSGAAGGITQYTWDFENDSFPDDFVPNPLHQYPCGTYDVTLTVNDANGSFSITKPAFVATDIVTPNFTWQNVGGTVVQFQDTSTPTPAVYDWDLDGDGIFGDSSLPNPVFAYPDNCGEVVVSLQVTLACQPAVTISKPIVIAQEIESTFDGGTITATGATNSANYLDVNVANAKGVNVCSMHVHSSLAAGNPLTVNIYQTTGTYVGKELDATQWRLVGTAVGTSRGALQRTLVQFNPPIHLAAGQFGLCMEHVEASMRYSNLGAVTTYSNADLSMSLGASQTTIFSTAPFTPRVANVALYYTTTQNHGTAGYGYIGFGCPGTAGVPSNRALTQPQLGGAATIEIGNLPFGIGVAAIGVVRSPGVDLGTLLGMTGCSLFNSPDVIQALIGAPGAVSFLIPIPNDPLLIGALIYNQALSLDPGVNPFDFTISDAAELLIGN